MRIFIILFFFLSQAYNAEYKEEQHLLYWNSCFNVSKEMALEKVKEDIAKGKAAFIRLAYDYAPIFFIVIETGEIMSDEGRVLFDRACPRDVFDYPTALVAPICDPREGNFDELDDICYYDEEFVAWYNGYLYNYFKKHPEKIERYRRNDAPPFKFPIQNDGLMDITIAP